jgi:hypothetical protein
VERIAPITTVGRSAPPPRRHRASAQISERARAEAEACAKPRAVYASRQHAETTMGVRGERERARRRPQDAPAAPRADRRRADRRQRLRAGRPRHPHHPAGDASGQFCPGRIRDLGGLLAYTGVNTLHLNIWFALAGATVAGFVLGLIYERVVLRPAARAGESPSPSRASARSTSCSTGTR